MGRLILLLALVLLVLAVWFIVRASRSSRQRRAGQGEGWFPRKIERANMVELRLEKYGHPGRREAVIYYDDPQFSSRLVEEWARIEVKADDWNSTNRALD